MKTKQNLFLFFSACAIFIYFFIKNHEIFKKIIKNSFYFTAITGVDIEGDVARYELVDLIQINPNVRNRRDLSTHSTDDNKVRKEIFIQVKFT